MTSIRLFLSLAATRNWPLYQLDVKNAFLHGDLQVEVYMEQPPDFVAHGRSDLVCRLRRSLYGLKQSSRTWFGRFSTVVQQFGLRQSGKDHTMFFHRTASGCILLVVYVDDIVITGDDRVRISSLKAFLQTQFQTKDLGHLRYFLGVEVARRKHGIFISQRNYVIDILRDVGLLNTKRVESPMDLSMKLLPGDGDVFPHLTGIAEWRENLTI